MQMVCTCHLEKFRTILLSVNLLCLDLYYFNKGCFIEDLRKLCEKNFVSSSLP